MNINDYQTYKPTSVKPRRSPAAIAALLAASFGMGMARDWSESNDEDKANYPDWWKSIVGYKAGTSANGTSSNTNALAGGSTGYKVPNRFMDGDQAEPYQVPNQFMDSNASEPYKVPTSIMDDDSGYKPYQLPNQFMDNQNG